MSVLDSCGDCDETVAYLEANLQSRMQTDAQSHHICLSKQSHKHFMIVSKRRHLYTSTGRRDNLVPFVKHRCPIIIDDRGRTGISMLLVTTNCKGRPHNPTILALSRHGNERIHHQDPECPFAYVVCSPFCHPEQLPAASEIRLWKWWAEPTRSCSELLGAGK